MKIVITAHSGCEGTPRDSVESIDRALECGAELIEVDVRRDENGVLRISHNQISQEEYETKPTLREVFEKIKDTPLGINCDIKETYLIPDVLKLAEEFGFGPGRLIMTGEVTPHDLTQIKDLNRKADIYMNIAHVFCHLYAAELLRGDRLEEYMHLVAKPFDYVTDPTVLAPFFPHIIKAYKSLGVKGINMPYQAFSEEVAALFVAAELPFSVWTVNDPGMAVRLMKAGAFNVTTTSPKLILEQRAHLYE